MAASPFGSNREAFIRVRKAKLAEEMEVLQAQLALERKLLLHLSSTRHRDVADFLAAADHEAHLAAESHSRTLSVLRQRVLFLEHWLRDKTPSSPLLACPLPVALVEGGNADITSPLVWPYQVPLNHHVSRHGEPLEALLFEADVQRCLSTLEQKLVSLRRGVEESPNPLRAPDAASRELRGTFPEGETVSSIGPQQGHSSAGALVLKETGKRSTRCLPPSVKVANLERDLKNVGARLEMGRGHLNELFGQNYASKLGKDDWVLARLAEYALYEPTWAESTAFLRGQGNELLESGHTQTGQGGQKGVDMSVVQLLQAAVDAGAARHKFAEELEKAVSSLLK